MANTIETNNLSFSYGKHIVLKNMSLIVPENSIYGLLGRNGAGKSTTFKLLLGLLPHGQNSIKYWGNASYGQEVFFRIGNMIESPALYNYMNVEEHLVMQEILFRKGESRIQDVLALVDLQNERKKKASSLSTGMKQRLAIAMALYRDPDLLMLDEPANGLDPIGIIEMRNLLLKLKQQGKTIVLSSHIIAEIEKVCSHIGILEEGELKFQGETEKIEAANLEEFYLQIVKARI